MFAVLSIKTPDTISQVLFISNGFNKLDAMLAISTLKFLGLVDAQNKPTDAMASLRIKGDKRKEEIKKIVEAAYKPLFDNTEAPQNLPKEELHNALSANYPKLSDRVYGAAIPVFYKLCEYAGLKEEGSVRGGWTVQNRAKQDKGDGTANVTKKTVKTGASLTIQDVPSGFHSHSIAKGKVNILISEEWNTKTLLDDKLFELWRTTLKAADAYAKEYEKENPSSSSG